MSRMLAVTFLAVMIAVMEMGIEWTSEFTTAMSLSEIAPLAGVSALGLLSIIVLAGKQT